MHVILATAGTDGDVIPYLRLGSVLLSRGHRVTLAANAHHDAEARRLGLDFRALVSRRETEERLSNPDFWHPVKGPLLASEWGTNFLDRQYALLAELADGGEPRGEDNGTVMVAAPLIGAARLVQEKMSVPLASVLLQPWGLPSLTAPPAMPYGFTLPRRAPQVVGRLYWRFVHSFPERRFGPVLNRTRRALGLESVRGVVRWAFSPQRIIGFFPDWYAPPQADWPDQLRLAGFPAEQSGTRKSYSTVGMGPDLLEFCRQEPPILFTFGTWMRRAASQVRTAVDACRRLGCPGVLLIPHDDVLPRPLPSFIRHCRYAPYADLFPRCSVIVHHGGIGTVAAALAAGLPQVIRPSVNDQPDNAARVRRLGVGTSVARRRGGRALARAISAVSTPVIRERCRDLSRRMAAESALEQAADWVEELVRPTEVSRRLPRGA